eukprot:scaffold3032_cov36-Phaeocystis_antarctica.AAC.1
MTGESAREEPMLVDHPAHARPWRLCSPPWAHLDEAWPNERLEARMLCAPVTSKKTVTSKLRQQSDTQHPTIHGYTAAGWAAGAAAARVTTSACRAVTAATRAARGTLAAA